MLKVRRPTVETLFAHFKQQLGIRRLQLRGLQKSTKEFHLAVVVQNLRRLVRLTTSAIANQEEAAAPA